MRIKLTKDSMDIVMSIVRKYNISIEDSIEFIIKNPQEIEITRGEIGQKHTTKNTAKNL